MSDPFLERILAHGEELEEQSAKFAERANDAAQRAARERQEAAKWPESSEWRERREKEAQRWSEIAERHANFSEHASKRSARIRTAKLGIQTGSLTFLPESLREEGASVSLLSMHTHIRSGGVEIVCQRCRRRDRFDAPLGRPLLDVALQEKAAAHFFKAGWRLRSRVLCPECSKPATGHEKTT